MSRGLLLCGMLAVAGGVGAHAQTVPAVPPPQGEKPVAGVVATVALTGCLERWSTEAAPAPNGAPAAPPPAGVEYVLTKVQGQTTSATSASPGQQTTRERDARYLLLSSPTMKLAPHLNHTVTILGSIAPQPSEGATPAEQIAEPSRAETNLPAAAPSEAFRLNLVEVSSIKMVASTCGK